MILRHHQRTYDLSTGIDLSIPVRRSSDSVEAFYIPHARMEPFRAGSFVGSVPEGGACNCEDIRFNAHGNGTHTECVGHVSAAPHYMADFLPVSLREALLISIDPRPNGQGDFLIHPEQIPESLPDALIIRTLPNDPEKLYRKYSGTNPIYLHPDTGTALRERGVKHLLVDLPSVDREEDGGALATHKNYWHYPEHPRLDASITELIFVPDEVIDGYYLLNLQFPGMESDAVPSRVVVYPSV